MARIGRLKSSIDKWKDIATIFSLVAVPIIVAVCGFLVQQSITNSQSTTKIIELSIQILKEPPGRAEQPGLRKWAIDMLQNTATATLSSDARRELERAPILPVLDMQRRVRRGGIIWLLKSQSAPKDGESAPIPGHTIQLTDISEDRIKLLIDRTERSLTINDSWSHVETGCVVHVLGLGYRDSFASSNTGFAAPEDRGRIPVNAAFIAYVCP